MSIESTIEYKRSSAISVAEDYIDDYIRENYITNDLLSDSTKKF
jgi:hypothetical protein